MKNTVQNYDFFLNYKQTITKNLKFLMIFNKKLRFSCILTNFAVQKFIVNFAL